MFYGMGLREMQLYWAVPNALKKADGTLSDFGIQVIGEMNRLGMVMDFSHMSAAAFDQAMRATRDPIVISHCAVAAVSNPGARARGGTDQLDDKTIRAMADNGGVICLHFFDGYIRPHHGPNPTVEDLVDHIDYIKNLVGTEYVGLGVDYSPMKGWRWIEGAEIMEGMVNVAREMVRRGYTDEEIERVLGLNLMRVYQQVWGGTM
jgi:membrane dipeptidase